MKQPKQLHENATEHVLLQRGDDLAGSFSRCEATFSCTSHGGVGFVSFR